MFYSLLIDIPVVDFPFFSRSSESVSRSTQPTTRQIYGILLNYTLVDGITIGMRRSHSATPAPGVRFY